MMKESIARLAPKFSMHRMLVEYAERFHLRRPQVRRANSLSQRLD
jgi:hypothetical protein